MSNYTRYGNMPAPLVGQRVSQRRRKRARRAAVVGGTAALFGTRRGKNILGAGLKGIGRVSPGARKSLAKGWKSGRAGARAARGMARSGGYSLFGRALHHFPNATTKAFNVGTRASSWLSAAKTALKAVKF